MTTSKIIWTKIDEAPALATHALLPIVQAYTKGTGVEVETSDISLAGRIIANFPDKLSEDQKIADHLTRLGDLAKKPEGNIIKLPNISASIPQLMAALKELKSKGYDIPLYPEEPKTDEERALQKRFAVVLGSAVNPVLREGNSDRRPAASVKKFAQKNPHRMMKPWPESGSQCRVAHMDDHDFYANENSVVLDKATSVRIEFVGDDGKTTVLKKKLDLLEGEVLDSTKMEVAALRKFYGDTIKEAKEKGVLLSLHLKATMMKVSDPIMFGHCVSVYYKDALDKHAGVLKEIGANVNYGLADVLDRLDRLPADKKSEIEADIKKVYETQPALAMVDSRKGITNLHVPNNIIVDASMPNVVRDGGKMWNNDDKLQDTIAMVPDRCYATIYRTIIEDCHKYGQFDPSTMGNVANVGLMAQKAEEYGSHDKTFEAPAKGVIRIVDESGKTLLEQKVAPGDIFRACQVKGRPDSGLGQACGQSRSGKRLAGDLLARRASCTRCRDHQEGEQVPAEPRHQGVGHSDHVSGRRDEVLAGEDSQGTGHDFGDGQRAPRLPDGPVPDSGARYERAHALDRPADEWRRSFRDGCRRLGAQACSAVPEGRPPALGFAR